MINSKKITFLVLAGTLTTACHQIENHYHDGLYEANVFTDASLSWVNREQIEIKGNTLVFRTISIIDSSILKEVNTSCFQYRDSIEYIGKDALKFVARVDSQGNIIYGNYSYKPPKIQLEDPSNQSE